MRRLWKVLATGAGVAIAAFAGITLVALEGQEVVVIETADPSGSVRRTRIWIADTPEGWMIEAGDPSGPLFGNLQRKPTAWIERGDQRVSIRATPLANPEGHERIRTLLRAKYGWADDWVALIADTSRSVAFRLEQTPVQ